MCGINGIIALRGAIDPALLIAQRDRMQHRGPDSSGHWVSDDRRIGFGHRRLAIIDLSPGGHQPMIDASTGNVITFNGEIYNYRELRDRLRGLGHRFATESDTEVILAAYRQWGDAALSQLDGMFAFALFDPTRREVLLARDRAGEKPLYFRATSGAVSFASEIKALLADPECPRRVNVAALNEYFAYGYVTQAGSLLDGIDRVPPGHLLRIRLESSERSIEPYWSLPAPRGEREAIGTEELVDELQALLEGAVARQLVADVPVGVLLSGGVDSSLVAAIAARVSASPVRTFTVRFSDDARFDEGPYAALVARHLGAEHTELHAQPADPDMLARLVAQFDDPIADSSMIPTFMVSQEIRRHATVAIGGDGGDELFGGYFRYPLQLRQERLRQWIPDFAREPILAVGRALPEGVPGRGTLSALALGTSASIANAGRIFRDDERRGLSAALRSLDDRQLQAPERRRAEIMRERGSLLQRATAVDFGTYMVDDVLVKVDRASMLCSLEVRAPFLDRSVIEFAFGRLPDALRATTRDRKVILRKLGGRLLPPELDLTRKQGFSIPINRWMREAWKPILDAEAESREPSIVDSAALRRYRDLLVAGRNVGDRLFGLLTLRMWERHYGITSATGA